MLNQNTIDNYIDNYFKWLKANYSTSEISNGIFRITTPFLDNMNDMIEIYLDNSNGNLMLSDGGNTINEFSLNGIEITEHKKKVLSNIIKKFGIYLNENLELYIYADEKTIFLKKHLLIQCILNIYNFISFSNTNNIISLFNDEVKNFFDAKSISYIANIEIRGKSSLPTNYDFAIPHTSSKKERYIKVFNKFDLQQARNTIFAWLDTSEERKNDSELITIINDTNTFTSDSVQALKEYDIQTLLWSKKEQCLDLVS